MHDRGIPFGDDQKSISEGNMIILHFASCILHSSIRTRRQSKNVIDIR